MLVYAEGTSVDKEKYLQFWFRNDDFAFGPILRPFCESSLKPREYILANFSFPDIFLCMGDNLYDAALRQVFFHSALRRFHLAGRPRDQHSSLEQEAGTIDSLVRNIDSDNSFRFNLSDLSARIILRGDEGFSVRRFPDSEDFLASMCSYDIETVDWWTDVWKSDLVALSFSIPGYPVSDFLLGTYPGRFPLKNAKYIPLDDELSLRLRTADFLRSSPVCITQNGVSYDNSRLSRRSFDQDSGKWRVDRKFFPSESCIPFRVAAAGEDGWGVKLLRKDGFDLDLMVHAMNYFPEAPDKKLETLDAYLGSLSSLRLGVSSDDSSDGSSLPSPPRWSKSLTYSELDACVDDYRSSGDSADILPRLLYAEEDSRIPLRLARIIIPPLASLARIVGCSYQSVFNDPPAKLARNWWDRLYFKSHGRPRLEQFDRDRKHLDYFDMEDFAPPKIPSSMQTSFFDDVREPALGPSKLVFNDAKSKIFSALSSVKTGFFRNLQLYHGSPVAESLRPVLLHDDIRQLFSLVDSSSDALSRCIFLSMLDSFTREPLWDLAEFSRNPSHARFFDSKYCASPEMVKDALDIGVSQRFEELSSLSLVNFSRNWFFTEGKGSLQFHGFQRFGEVDAVSIGPGCLVYRFNDMLFSSGIKIPGKKKRLLEERVRVSEPELKTNIQYDFLESFFSDPAQSIDYLNHMARSLSKSRFDLDRLVWRVVVSDDPRFRSLRSRQLRTARVVSSLDGRVGDSLYALAVKDQSGEQSFLGYDYGEKRFFSGSLRERSYLDFDGEYFNSSLSLDLRFYQDWILGPGSLVYKVLSSVLPKISSPALKRLVYGFADKDDILYIGSVLKNS